MRVIREGKPYRIGNTALRICAMNWFLALMLQAAAVQPSHDVPSHPSTVALTVGEKDLFPEGLVYDAQAKCFYISSMLKRKILRIDSTGETTEFKSGGQDGLYQVLGLKVDLSRRILWACTATESNDKELDGYSAVFKYDLVSGRLLKKFLLDNKEGPHLFNDIAVTTLGDVFFTDSRAGSVYTIKTAKNKIETLIAPNTLTYPNGIALSSDDKFLFVAHAEGIDAVELNRNRRIPIAAPTNETIKAIDGLYFYHGSLIGIQTGRTVQRVVRLRLNPQQTSVERLEVLDTNDPLFDIPTTGCIIGKEFYFIGNSQMDKLNDDGTIRSASDLQPIRILKLKLDQGNR